MEFYFIQKQQATCLERGGGAAIVFHKTIEQVAGPITGEGAASAVCALHPRSQADNEQTGVFRTEGRNGTVEPIRVVLPFLVQKIR